jgi:hypothetical protein
MVLALAFAISGCAGMSKEECEKRDWYAFGVEQGAKGNENTKGAGQVETCQREGVALEPTRFLEGWREGLKAHCTTDRGTRDAKKGRLTEICVREKVTAYVEASRSGLATVLQTKEGLIEELNEKMAELEKEKTKLSREIEGLKNEAGKVQ